MHPLHQKLMAIQSKIHGQPEQDTDVDLLNNTHLHDAGHEPGMDPLGQMHPAIQLEMHKQAVKEQLKKVRHQELYHEMHQMHKERSRQIDEESEGMFDK